MDNAGGATEMPRPTITVVAVELVQELDELLAGAAAAADVTFLTGRQISDQTRGDLWLVDAGQIDVLVKRIGRRPAGAERVIAVARGPISDATWWACGQLTVDLVMPLPGGEQVVLDAVSDTVKGHSTTTG